jgi:hypothetical protein
MKRFKGYVKIIEDPIDGALTYPGCVDSEYYVAVVKYIPSHGTLFDPNDVFHKFNFFAFSNVPLQRNFNETSNFTVLWDYVFKMEGPEPSVRNNTSSTLITIPDDPVFYTERVSTVTSYNRSPCSRTVFFDIPMDEVTTFYATENLDYRDIQTGSLHIICLNNLGSTTAICVAGAKLNFDKFH